jgi:hypothetical protein
MVQFRGFPKRRGGELRIAIQRTRHRVADVYSDVKSNMSIRNDFHSLPCLPAGSNAGAKTSRQKPHLCPPRRTKMGHPQIKGPATRPLLCARIGYPPLRKKEVYDASVVLTLSFICHLLRLAWDSSVASMGTTTLAVSGSLLYPLIRLIQELNSSGWNGLKQHWKEQLKTTAIIALSWWGILFAYHLFYKVPHTIRNEAERIKPPITYKAIGLPSSWDFKTVWPIKKHGPAFSVIVEDKIFGIGGDHPTRFWVVQGTRDGGCVLSPVDMLLFLSITNLQPKDVLISTYDVRMGKVDLPRLNMLVGNLVFLPDRGTLPRTGVTIDWIPGGEGHMSVQAVRDADPSHGAQVTGAEILDTELGGKYIEPNKTVRGWAFFQYPKQGYYAPVGDFVITVSDQVGNKFQYTIPHRVPEGNSNGDVLPRTTTIGKIIDFSGCSLERQGGH